MFVIVMIMWLMGTVKPNRKEVAAAPAITSACAPFNER